MYTILYKKYKPIQTILIMIMNMIMILKRKEYLKILPKKAKRFPLLL